MSAGRADSPLGGGGATAGGRAIILAGARACGCGR